MRTTFSSPLRTKYNMTKALGLDNVALARLWRPLDPSLRTHVKVIWPDQLEHGVIFDRSVSLPRKLVAVDELGQEDLDLLKSEVEPDTHPGTHGKWNVSGLVSVLHLVRVPPVGVEPGGVVPNRRIVMDVVKRGDNN